MSDLASSPTTTSPAPPSALPTPRGGGSGGGGARVVVVDYGAGNLLSLTRALVAVGAHPQVVTTRGELRALATTGGGVDVIALSGVGAAGTAMATLEANGLADDLRERRWPLLGVCLGMQLMFEWLDEGECAGLGLLPGVVRRLQPGAGYKVPHMGWNRVTWEGEFPLFGELATPAYYFVHSYTCVPTAPDAGLASYAWTDYGQPICAAVSAPGVVGVQFHPEKSGDVGLATLGRALALLRTPQMEAVR